MWKSKYKDFSFHIIKIIFMKKKRNMQEKETWIIWIGNMKFHFQYLEWNYLLTHWMLMSWQWCGIKHENFNVSTFGLFISLIHKQLFGNLCILINYLSIFSLFIMFVMSFSSFLWLLFNLLVLEAIAVECFLCKFIFFISPSFSQYSPP